MAYNLRTQATKNYKDTCTLRMPRAERVEHDPDKLYAVEVLEKDENRVKIHYVGYSTVHDEWRDVEDIVPPSDEPVQGGLQMELYRPLELHR